ncbi:MAG: KpsF/GutQ family sugar-phosphate isomerase [Candidatus Auribacterota bacterium]
MKSEGASAVAEKPQTTDCITLAKKVIRTEADSVRALESRLDDSFVKAVDLIAGCTGRVIVTGMGKPGLIGRKISATLASTGTPSLSMHPAEAMHGDLGMVQKNDVVLAMSNSGETDELTRLLPVIKKIGVQLISLVGNTESTLAKYSDVVLDVSVEKEACPMGLAPTASTTATLAMGDALAICACEKKGFKVEDFALYHPGGMLGRRLLLTVGDIMRKGKDNPIVSESALISDVLLAVTHAHAGAAAIVDSDGKLVGFFTDGDLRRGLEKTRDLVAKPVREYMTRNPYRVKPDCLAAEALKLLKEKRIDELPVVDEENRPVGLLDEGDLLGL